MTTQIVLANNCDQHEKFSTVLSFAEIKYVYKSLKITSKPQKIEAKRFAPYAIAILVYTA